MNLILSEIEIYELNVANLPSSPYMALLSADAILRLKEVSLKDIILKCFAVSLKNRAIGIAICGYLKKNGPAQSEVAWIFIHPHFRRNGIGKVLLKRVEETLRSIGCKELRLKVEVPYQKKQPFYYQQEELNGLLISQQWPPLKSHLISFRSKMANFSTCSWIKRVKLYPSFSLFLWKELTLKERKTILQKKRDLDWYPDFLSPFEQEHPMEPLNSLGLKHNNEVIGWMITQRSDPLTIVYADCFIAKEWRHLGFGSPLITKAMEIHMGCPEIPDGIILVNTVNILMVRFVEARIQPYADKGTLSYLSIKEL